MKIFLILLSIPILLAIAFVLLFNFSPAFKRVIGKYLYNLLYGLKWGESRMNNYGYAPAGPEAIEYSPGERYQLQLYREMALSIGDEAWKDRVVLEVGCGRGGGLHFLYGLLRPAHAHGLDFSRNAISSCQETFAADKDHLHYVQGDAMALPFKDHEFDIVFNVESSHIYADQAKFLMEVARILKPGARFVIADYRPLGEGLQKFHDDAAAAGLVKIGERKISKEVLAACQADSDRRKALIARAPAFVRNYLQEFAMTDSSKEYAHFEERYFYFIMEFRKGN